MNHFCDINCDNISITLTKLYGIHSNYPYFEFEHIKSIYKHDGQDVYGSPHISGMAEGYGKYKHSTATL